MRALLVASMLAGCGRIGFDAAGGGQGTTDADAPIPDAATFTAPCDTPTLVATGDVVTPLAAAAEGTSYRASWLDGNSVMHVLGIERTGDNVAVAERTFAPSAFLPSPLGSSIAVAGGTTIAVMFDDGASELRKLAGAQLGTARSIAYTARVTEVARAGAQAVALRTGADLFAQAIDPAAFELGSSVLVDMQMTEGERAAALPDGVVIVAARPNADDCNIYAYSPALAARGTAVVPNDANRCDEIAAASSAAQGAIAYTYAAQVTEIRVQAINAAGTPGPSVDIGGGTLPAIASGGTLFRVTFRTPTGVYQVATVTSGLLMQTVDNLHPTPLRSAALASNAGEVIAMYATTDTPNQVFLRRFCGS